MTASLVLAALALSFAPGPALALLGGLLAIPGRLAGRMRRPRPLASPAPTWAAEAANWRGGLGRPVLIVVEVGKRKGFGQ